MAETHSLKLSWRTFLILRKVDMRRSTFLPSSFCASYASACLPAGHFSQPERATSVLNLPPGQIEHAETDSASDRV